MSFELIFLRKRQRYKGNEVDTPTKSK